MKDHDNAGEPMTTPRPRVLLWDIDRAFLIVEWENQIAYENQVGGLDCRVGVQEGILVPLGFSEEELDKLFKLPFEASGLGITPTLADQMDALFSGRPSFFYISVDRERLQDSCEAWVYVRLGTVPEVKRRDDASYLGMAYGVSGRRGVITWPNSD